MYGEENYLYMLYLHRGNARKAQKELDSLFGIGHRGQVYKTLQDSHYLKYKNAVQPAKDNFQNKQLETAQAQNRAQKHRENTLEPLNKMRDHAHTAEKSNRSSFLSYQKELRQKQAELKEVNRQIDETQEVAYAITQSLGIRNNPHEIKMELQLLISHYLPGAQRKLSKAQVELGKKDEALTDLNKEYAKAKKAYTEQFWGKKNIKRKLAKFEKMKKTGQDLSDNPKYKITKRNLENRLQNELNNPHTNLTGKEGGEVKKFQDDIKQVKSEVKQLRDKIKFIKDKEIPALNERLKTMQNVYDLHFEPGGLQAMYQQQRTLPQEITRVKGAQSSLKDAMQAQKSRKKEYDRKVNQAQRQQKSLENEVLKAQKNQKKAEKNYQQQQQDYLRRKKETRALRRVLLLRQQGSSLPKNQVAQLTKAAKRSKDLAERAKNNFTPDECKALWSMMRTLLALYQAPKFDTILAEQPKLLRLEQAALKLLQAEIEALAPYAQNSSLVLKRTPAELEQQAKTWLTQLIAAKVLSKDELVQFRQILTQLKKNAEAGIYALKKV